MRFLSCPLLSAWQKVKAGTIFDNILVTDDVDYAAKVGKDTWGATKEPEKAAKAKVSGPLAYTSIIQVAHTLVPCCMFSQIRVSARMNVVFYSPSFSIALIILW